MGRTYTVPRSVKGESRLLYIFSIRSFVSTVVFGFVGFLIGSLLSLVGASGLIKVIMTAVFGIIGYGMATLVIPDTPIVGNLRKAGGEQVGEILLRIITFKRRKKIYIYRYGGDK